MRRREFLGLVGAASAVTLSAPRLSLAQGANTIKMISNGDLAVLDPLISTTDVTRNAALMVYDTLFGVDGDFAAQPQMVDTVKVENDGLLWRMTLRDGLRFHDGEPVRAKDCVASLKRWSKRDDFGKMLFAVVDELSANGDKEIVFRLSKPFPRLIDALAKPLAYLPVIMPERLAQTDPNTAVKEMIGSGPFRFKADEHVAGVISVFERNRDYVPRPDGVAVWTAGPKRVFVDRVEWMVQPDPSTAVAALQTGEVDWWEAASNDLLPLLTRRGNFKVEPINPLGSLQMMMVNHLHPPFDKPAMRQALWPAINQSDFMVAINGTVPGASNTGVGFFVPQSPFASNAGMEALTGPRDLALAKRNLEAAGYAGEPLVVMAVSNVPLHRALAEVGTDMLRKVGLNISVQTMDFTTMSQRRNMKDAPAQGGWHIHFTGSSGMNFFSPAVHRNMRGAGPAGQPGWDTNPDLERLTNEWFASASLDKQKDITRDMQVQAFKDVPYYPLGQSIQQSAYTKNIVDRVVGYTVFWNLRKEV
ncbi:ABC transporter substrate-binding protein [Hyphomicrobiales bacterium]|nr:ABC transporter substrate-binding protein [Hyphomicrobiales bacterium]CAH1677661.1 ABC transporter substrate-binding protein [Hyphomicrobiales bacterium]